MKVFIVTLFSFIVLHSTFAAHAATPCVQLLSAVQSIDTGIARDKNLNVVSLQSLERDGLLNRVIRTEVNGTIKFDHVSFIPGDFVVIQGPKRFLKYGFFPVYKGEPEAMFLKIYDAENYKFLKPVAIPFEWDGLGFEVLENTVGFNSKGQEVLKLSFRQRGGNEINKFAINLETLEAVKLAPNL